MIILEQSLGQPPRLTAAELLVRVRASGLQTPAESAKVIRRERDERSRQ